MNPFFNIIWKNFKLLLRARTSALVIFLGPLIIVTLLGAAFSNTGAYEVNIGVYSSSYSALADELLGKFDQEKYKINRIGSEESCIESVKTGENNLCMVMPPNLDLQTSQEIGFNVDYSEINLVYAVLDVIGEKVGEKSTEITQSLADELLTKIAEAKSKTDEGIMDITSIKSKSSEASSKIASVKSDLLSITVYDASQINLNPIESKIDDIKDLLEDVNASLLDAQGEIEDLDDSPEKTAALAEIASAISDVGTGLQLIDNSSNSSSSASDLESMVSSVKESVANATLSLNQLKSAKDASANDLGGVKSKIDESIASLNSLETKNKGLMTSLGSLTVSSAEKITTPIKTKINSVVKESTYFNFIFSTLVVMIIMITSILLASTLIMSEKKSKAFFRNYITPANDFTFNSGMFFTAFIIIISQLAIFLAVSEIFFQTSVLPSIMESSIILVLITSFFISLGMFIGYLFKSSETNTLASISISALLLFMSSAVLPIESMPDRFRIIAGFNPFVIAETALRKTIFFHFNVSQIQMSIYILLGYTIVMLLLAGIVQKTLRHRIFFHLHKKGPEIQKKKVKKK